jgi:sugar phosphate isomerase/epimerase
VEIGIFAKTFVRPSLEETLDAIAAHGIRHVQFNMACTGCPSLPDNIEPALEDRVRVAHEARGISMAAVSGTFNMIHPDPAVRKRGLARLLVLAKAAPRMGTRVVTLCTGTRDPDDMWRRHADNDTNEAWSDLLESMEAALRIAEDEGLTLAVEPEVSNVVDSARKGRALLDTMQSPRLAAVIDGANLFHAGELPRMREILDEAFDLLGDRIVLAHAKDLSRDGEAGHAAAGTGLLDYDHYIACLRRVGYSGPLVLHGLGEPQVPECVAFLRRKLARGGRGA